VLSGLGRQRDQVCSKGRPGRLTAEPRNDLVGPVELRHGLRSDELLGCDVEAVGVALHRITEPDGRVTELSQQRGGRGGGVVSSEDSLQRLGGRAGCDRVGLDEGMGSPSQTTCR